MPGGSKRGGGGGGGGGDDPFSLGGMEAPAQGSIASVLSAARASLKEPSRPYTPAETRQSRSQFDGTDYRPQSRAVSRSSSGTAPLQENGE